jgi:hypothetical protein
MSIHDFHSKLMSGKEEGRFIEALRRLKCSVSLAIWNAEDGSSDPAPGWAVWEETSGLPA